ncbi:MAG TPA: type II secretion system protein [Nitrospirota bacterium]
MNSSKFRVQGSPFPQFRIPHSAFRNTHGFSYIALLVAIVIIGISLGAAGKYWQNVMLREKEEELLFRGNQYRQAIERYYTAIPGRAQYPQNIDDLLKDSRTPAGKRHLRQKYTDPMTGEDFEIITAQTASALVRAAAPQSGAVPGIIGVHSKSEKEPLKKDNFPPANENLAGKSTYNEWLFIAFTGTTPPVIPGQAQVVSQPRTTARPHSPQ